MSGHSHYATIHRQKELADAKRGNLFSKLARAIAIAVRAGGPNPDANLKLRVAIEKARAANMPKGNIERAVSKGGGGGEALEEVVYEGFGPSGISVIVEAATDNKNRTGQEIKNLFERGGGRLAGPGAVLYNFENKGFFLVKKSQDPQTQILTLIDLGVEDFQETGDGIEVYVVPERVGDIRKKLETSGFEIMQTELQMKPKNLQEISEPNEAAKAIKFLEQIEEHADIQKVYTNLDIPEELLGQIT